MTSRVLISVILVALMIDSAVASVEALPTETTRPASRPDAVIAQTVAQLLDESPEEARTHKRQCESLEGCVRDARLPLDKAEALLALANWHLSVPTARPATWWLVGIDRPADRHLIAEQARVAMGLLAEARGQLDSAAPASGSQDNTRRSYLQLATDTLGPFASLFQASGMSGDHDAFQLACAEAATGLSMSRESDEPDIAAAAMLWQSFAWKCSGRPHRALKSLPTALSVPENGSFGLGCRLLRCRTVADMGQNAAALAMTIRVTASCEKWFSQELPRQIEDRQRLAVLVQRRIGETWLAQLRQADAPSADSLQQLLIRAGADAFAPRDGIAVYSLDRAIPIIVQAPVLSSSAPSTRTDPTTPDSVPASENVTTQSAPIP